MSNHGPMNCPVCRVALVMSDRQGIEIDYCPDCRGVWLDRGELDKIIERSAAHTPPAASSPGHGSHASHGHQQPYYGKKRKSFLGELFD